MRRLLVLSFALLTACGPVEAEPRPSGAQVASRTDAILRGDIAFTDPQVFAMFMRYPTGGYTCSATLIGKRTLLTAAHCIAPEDGEFPRITVTNALDMDTAPDETWIAGVKARVHPFYKSEVVGKYDIGAVELEREPTVVVKPWNTASIDDLLYVPMRVAGYGITNTDLDDSGLKRTGMSRLDAVRGDQLDFGREGANRTGTCSGDSGGPGFYTFPDGVERVIGVHSFHTGGCGNNTDARVDRFQMKVLEWLSEFEQGTCDADLRCQTTGCATPDPDCACLEDGQCNAACTAGAVDPDCAASCAEDGVCSHATCASADPDCQAPGEDCGHAGQCSSRLCITSEQHAQPYCSQTCSGTSACPSGLQCVSGQCEIAPLPTATEGNPCTVGGTYCVDPGFHCASWAQDTTTRCMRTCFRREGCESGQSCAESSENPDVGVCVNNVILPILRDPPLTAFGCSSIPVASWGLFALPLVLILARRRRLRAAELVGVTEQRP